MNTFDQLPLAEKIRLIKLAGKFIVTITHQSSSVSLYQINNFFVEKHIDDDTKKIVKISSVSYREMLKYLPHISIDSLYNLIS